SLAPAALKLLIKMNNGTNTLAFVHQVKRVIDVIKPHGVGTEIVKPELALHVALNKAWQLSTALHTTKRRAFPDPPGNQLEGTGGDFLAGTGNTDNHRL